MEPMKILVVDDEVQIREMLRKNLTQMGGFPVEVASGGVEALEKIEKDVFDLVLTDLKMPEMGGDGPAESPQGDKAEIW
jgi:CheY-like chemotaxis protein